MERRRRRSKPVNNPFPRQPKSSGFIQGKLFFNPQLIPSQVCSAGENFTIHWSDESGGVLWIQHRDDDPERRLWSTVPGSTAFVTAALGDELVEEFRGSFAIHDTIKTVCKYQTVDMIGAFVDHDQLMKQQGHGQHNAAVSELITKFARGKRRVDGDGAELLADGPAVVVTGLLYSDERVPMRKLRCEARADEGRTGEPSIAVRYWLVFSERRPHHLSFSVHLDQPVLVYVDSDSVEPSLHHLNDDELSADLLDKAQWLWSERVITTLPSLGKGIREEYLERKKLSRGSRVKPVPLLPKLNRVHLTYLSNKNESFFGFGEQFSCFDLKGRRVPILVQEQGLGRGDQPITAAANFLSYRAGGSWHTTYAPSPYYMTSELRSLFLEGYHYSVFDLQQHDRVQVQVHAGGMEGRILHGKSPGQLLLRYTEAIGRMRQLPDWIVEGAVIGMQGGTSAVKHVLGELKRYQVPTSAFWLQDWVGQRKTSIGWQLWWNWEADTEHYTGWGDLVKELRSEGIRTMTYCNPLLASVELKSNKARNLFQEAMQSRYLIHGPDQKPYMITNTSFDAGMVDITNPEARSWLKGILRDMIRTGIRGWMADFGEALPFDSVLHSGDSSSEMHNRYPELWAELNREVAEEWEEEVRLSGRDVESEQLVFFMRAGYRESPRWSTLFWEGDQMISWQRNDGIKSAVVGLLSGGISGYSLNHSDIGGYTTVNVPFVKYVRTEELLIRWMELNAFSVVFRTHEGNLPGVNSQFYSSSRTISYFARCAKLYKAWEFYRKLLVKEASTCGMPVVRHMFLHFPDDEYVRKITYQQFMVGSEILVVPVLDKGKSSVLAYFPDGGDAWEHIWSRRVYSYGEAWIDAPLGFPAVFIRSRATEVKAKLYENLAKYELQA